jgi:LacI family transcriptional regulator
MAGRVTIAHVAAEVGVSAMTVSNVLNGRPGASDETRRLVLEAARRLGYTPNAAARSLKNGRSGLVGLITLDLTAQYTLEIIRGVAEELADVELELLINASYHDATREQDRIRVLSQGMVDGLILVAPVLKSATLKFIQKHRVPCVIIDPRQIDTPLPRVGVDGYEGMRAGVEHLLSLGHRRIAFLRGDEELQSSELRFRGYADALRLAGLDLDDALIRTCSFSYGSGFRTASTVLKEMPTAIAAGGDLIALGAVDAARAAGIDVPRELSVLGFDDLPQAGQSFPGLTTVRQPLHDMGLAGARALVSLLEGQNLVTEDIRLATSLVIRGSTGPAPGADEIALQGAAVSDGAR